MSFINNNINNQSYDFSITNISNNTTGPQLLFEKNRSLSLSPVITGDVLGGMYFGGADSASTPSFKLGIQAISTGTIGADRIPFNLGFYTAQDAALAPEVIRMVITTTGETVINKADTDTQTIGTPAATLSVIGSSFIAANEAANTSGAFAQLIKNRSGGIITSGDTLGTLGFMGADSGSTESAGSYIRSVSSGTVGVGRIPADLQFWTKPDSATAISQRVVINPSGNLIVNRADDDNPASLSGTTASFTCLGGSVVGSNSAANTVGGITTLFKDRAGGPITTGDDIGYVQWVARDSASAATLSAQIRVTSTGVIGAAQVPSNMFLAVSNTAGALTDRVEILTGGLVKIDGQLSVGADLGAGTVSNIDLTNTSDLTANGVGTFTIKSKSGNPLDSSGFIKIYISGTAYFIPVFSAVAP